MDIKKFKILGDLQQTNSKMNREFEQKFTEYKKNIIENDKKIIIKFFNDNDIKTRDEVSTVVAGYGQSYLTVKFSNPEDNFIGANMRYQITVKAGNVVENFLLTVLLEHTGDVNIQTAFNQADALTEQIDIDISDYEEKNIRLKLLIERINNYHISYQIYKGNSFNNLLKTSDNLVEVLSEIFN